MLHFIKLIGSLALSVLCLVSFAQKTSGLNYYAISEVGQDLKTSTPINGIEYSFSTPIYNYKPNLANNLLLVELRHAINNDKKWLNHGALLAYDPSAQQTKWTNTIGYWGSSRLFYEDAIIERKATKSYRLNPENGKEMWKSRTTFLGLFDSHLGLSFSHKMKGQTGVSSINGIDLATGETLWQRKLLEPYVESVHLLNDSTLLAFSAGLYVLNLNDNGKGWDVGRVMSTTKTDFNKAGAAFITGLVSGLLTGFSVIPSTSSIYSGITSNVLQENNEFYFSSANKLERYILRNGNYLWSQPVDEKIASRSHLFKVDNLLCQINFGHALNNGIPKRYGKPFLATYNPDTGEQLSIKMLENNKDFVIDHFVMEGKVYLLFKSSLEMYELVGNEFVLRKKTTTDNQTKMLGFSPKSLHIKMDNGYLNPSGEQRANFIFNEDGELLQLDEDFLVVKKIEKTALYSTYLDTKNYKFIGNNDTTFVLEKITNVPIATLNASRFSRKVGTRLYDHKKEKLREIDISRFLKEN